MRILIAALAFGALSTYLAPAYAAAPTRHSVAANGLRYDERFDTVVAAGPLFDDVHRRDPSAHTFSLSLVRQSGRIVWKLLAAIGPRVYTMRGRYAAPVATYTFDALSGKLLSRTLVRISREPTVLPNSTPSLGQRPRANATSRLTEFPSLKYIYERAYARAHASHAYVVEVALIPFGSALAKYQPGVFGYDTEAARMTIVTTIVAPHGMDAHPCYFDYVVVTLMVDAVTQSGGGASMRGRCRPGTSRLHRR